MLLSGFMVAGPDSVLGGAACADVCEHAGLRKQRIDHCFGNRQRHGQHRRNHVWRDVCAHQGQARLGGSLAAMTDSFLGAAALIPWIRASSRGQQKNRKTESHAEGNHQAVQPRWILRKQKDCQRVSHSHLGITCATELVLCGRTEL